MNIDFRAILTLWTFILTTVALVMVFANPWFENKKLLKLTLIPIGVAILFGTLLVGNIVR